MEIQNCGYEPPRAKQPTPTMEVDCSSTAKKAPSASPEAETPSVNPSLSTKKK